MAVVLAGGAGSRWDGGGHKLAARAAGVPVLRRAVDAALAAGLDETLVVFGALTPDAVELPAGVTVVINAGWGVGQASSLAVAVEHARTTRAAAVVVGLGDQPGVVSEAWRRVAAADATPVAVATYDGCRGHPVRFAAEVWPELPREGGTPGSVLMARRPEWVGEVPCPGLAADVDTLADLAALTPYLTEEPSCS